VVRYVGEEQLDLKSLANDDAPVSCHQKFKHYMLRCCELPREYSRILYPTLKEVRCGTQHYVIRLPSMVHRLGVIPTLKYALLVKSVRLQRQFHRVALNGLLLKLHT
jgi:hypothetical protein